MTSGAASHDEEARLAALYDRQYTCQVCGTLKVVPGLARDCEKRHARMAAERS